MANTCETCRYGFPNNESSLACHRYPPTITKVEDTRVTCFFPLVAKLAWCGEWKRKPN